MKEDSLDILVRLERVKRSDHWCTEFCFVCSVANDAIYEIKRLRGLVESEVSNETVESR